MEKIFFWHQCEGWVSQADIWRWGSLILDKGNTWGGEGEEKPIRNMEDTMAISREESWREGGRSPGCCLVEMLLLGQSDRKEQLRVRDAASKSVQGWKGQAKEGHMGRVVRKLQGVGNELVLQSGEDLSSCPCPQRHLHWIHHPVCSISQPEFTHQPSNWTHVWGANYVHWPLGTWTIWWPMDAIPLWGQIWACQDYKRVADLYYRNLYSLLTTIFYLYMYDCFACLYV